MSSGADAVDLTSLTRAVENSNVEEVQSLIDAGSDVNTTDGSGTPLFRAAKNGHLTILKLLVKAGASVNAGSSDRSTPLIAAVCSKHQDCVEELICAGADVNLRDDKNKVTLLIAAIGNIPCMDILVKAGAQLNPKLDDKKTRNPLLEAFDQNDIKSVKFLVEKGAKIPSAVQCACYGLLGCFDTNIETEPLWSTIISDNMDMFKALVEGGADLADGIRAAAYYAHYRGLKLMIEVGANVNCVDEGRNTILMRAV